MSTNIKLKRSSVQGKVPSTTDLELGELAINTYDGKLYMKKNDGTDSIVDITSGGAAPSLDLVTTAGSTTNNSITVGGVVSTGDISLGDNAKAIFGAGSDLQIYHDGVNSRIYDVGTGDLRIQGSNLRLQDANGENFLYAVQDGSVTIYYDNAAKLATTNTGIDVTGNATFGDNGKAIFGASSDLQIYHDGSNSFIQDSGTGDLIVRASNTLYLQSYTGAENYLTATTNGAVTAYYDNAVKLATTSTGVAVTGDATFGDNGKAIFGAGDDLQIYSDGNSAFIKEQSSTGSLFIDGNLVTIRNPAGTENKATFEDNGAVTLYYDNAAKLATTNTGIDVTGTVTADGLTVDGNVSINGSTTETRSIELGAGRSGDGSSFFDLIGDATYTDYGLRLIRNAGANSGSALRSRGTGDLAIQTIDDASIAFQTNSKNALRIANNNDISFYEDTGTTAQMVWEASADALTFGDNVKATFGTGSDLQIYHDGSNSYISDVGQGVLYIQGSNNVQIESATGENMAVFLADNAVELYYDNAKKFQTTSTGVDVTGTVTADGLTVDGDVSVIKAISYGGSADIDFVLGASNVGGGVNDSKALAWRWKVAGNQNGQLLDLYEIYDNGATNAERKTLTFNGGGDISFYEDTGTTAQLVWDASADALTFGDSVKATFGAGPDLQIFHDGSNSYVKDTGTGDLMLQGVNVRIQGATTGNNMFVGVDNGASTLYYQNAAKLATTSTGVDVTGTVTANGLVTDTTNGVKINTSSTVEASWTHVDVTGTSTINVGRNSTWGGELIIQTDTKNRANFASNGDISFYEDTGTTPKFFWDASAEALGIGTSSPDRQLVIHNSSSFAGLKLSEGTYNTDVRLTSSDGGFGILGTFSAHAMLFYSNSAERLRITSSGNVGIGTSSPAAKLQVTNGTAGRSSYSSDGDDIVIDSTGSGSGMTIASDRGSYGVVYFGDQDSGTRGIIKYDHADNSMQLGTSGTERLRIDSSGNVGIGTTNPAVKLEIKEETATTNAAVDTLKITQHSTGTTTTGFGSSIYFVGERTDGTLQGQGRIGFIAETNTTTDLSSGFFVQAARAGVPVESFRVHSGSSTVGYLSAQASTQVRLVLGSAGNYADNTSNWIRGNSNYLQFNNAGSGFTWENTGTEVMRLDTDGNLSIVNGSPELHFGTTSASHYNWRVAAQEAVDGGFEIASGTQVAGTGAGAANDTYTTRFTIKADTGNVGIGTTSPKNNLDVVGSTGIYQRHSSGGRLVFDDSDTADASTPMSYISNVAGALQFGRADRNASTGLTTNSTESMRIDSSGNVGIGTSAPASVLHVQSAGATSSSVRIENTSAPGSDFSLSAGIPGVGNSGFSIYDNDGTATRLHITSTGNVGIGSTNPQDALDLANGAGGRGITWAGASGAARYNSIFSSYSGASLVLSSLFHGSTSSDSYVTSFTGTTRASGIRLNWTDDNGIQFFTDTAAAKTAGNAFVPSERMRITPSGSVGIGTSSPTQKLHVSAGHIITSNNYDYRSFDTVGNERTLVRINSSNELEYGWSGAGPVKFMGGGSYTERMRIHTNGNVGIGTTTPGYKLEVNGSFAATTKSFVIDHPTKEGMKLRHGSLEGPENGVYVRGRLKENNIIELPDYWTGLVHEDSITVNLTAIGGQQDLWVEDIKDNKVYVGSDSRPINCFYVVYGTRKDIEQFDVEYS